LDFADAAFREFAMDYGNFKDVPVSSFRKMLNPPLLSEGTPYFGVLWLSIIPPVGPPSPPIKTKY